MDYSFPGRLFFAEASIVALALLTSSCKPAQSTTSTSSIYGAVLHATISVSGGITFTGTYDDPLPIKTCADVVKSGTILPGSGGVHEFLVPEPPEKPDGSPGPVNGGHTFATDAGAMPYHGPGTYSGSGLTATQMDVDTRPGSEDYHIFAFPTDIGTMVINPDASGSFQFTGLQDPGSVIISGQVTWTCS